jgi:hypothetical protein
MWWQRRLNILEHDFWWSSASIRAPDPHGGVESECGWPAIRDSNSGRLQAVLVVYGVPSLLRLATVQCRLRPSDLDENVDWKISTEEVINFMYLNLESLLHIVIAGLFITIAAARVGAGDECDSFLLHTEKNATAIAALGLFFNLFILCKPYKGFGLLVLTWYRFLLADVFNFLVMYCMIFLAFLIALQTLHNSYFEYLIWMDQSDDILPRVQAAIQKLYPRADPPNQAYLVNANPPASNQLLTTQVALDGCRASRRDLQDTAFALLEISFGDGLADALEQARSKPFECAGFSPGSLTGYLLVFWVFLTNTLIINMLISMMNHTFDKQIDSLNAVWLLDISKRIMRYEHHFRELAPRMQRHEHIHPMHSKKYWLCRLEDLGLVLFCTPEIHAGVLIMQAMNVYATKFRQVQELDKEVGPLGATDGRKGRGIPWSEVKGVVDAMMDESAPGSCSGACSGITASAWDMFWHPHQSLVRSFHPTSLKVVAFGYRAEKHAREYTESDRLSALIYRLEQLKDSLQNRKLKIHEVALSEDAGGEGLERGKAAAESESAAPSSSFTASLQFGPRGPAERDIVALA